MVPGAGPGVQIRAPAGQNKPAAAAAAAGAAAAAEEEEAAAGSPRSPCELKKGSFMPFRRKLTTLQG